MQPIVTALRTVGLSPKAVLAFLYPFLSSLGALAIAYIVTGDFDAFAARMALGGLVASALAALGAWLGKPGDVKVPALLLEHAPSSPPPASALPDDPDPLPPLRPAA